HHDRARVQLEATDGHEVYLAGLWVHRPFLREGYLKGRTFRCLVEPGDQGGIELLPWDAEPASPVVLHPEWLAWNDGTILKMVEAIAAETRFDELPILGDALEEAGCTNQAMLDHLRESRAHGSRCWVVDLLRGE